MQQSGRPGTPRPTTPLPFIDTDTLSNEHNPETDEVIRRFRTRITQWKKENLLNGITEEEDDTAIDKRKEMAEQFRQEILARIMELASSQEGEFAEEIDSLMEILGPRDQWSPMLIPQLTSLLFTDLFEHPFNFNPTLIQQFKNDNVRPF
jgi:hypothetical protein